MIEARQPRINGLVKTLIEWELETLESDPTAVRQQP